MSPHLSLPDVRQSTRNTNRSLLNERVSPLATVEISAIWWPFDVADLAGCANSGFLAIPPSKIFSPA
jgi:hypothetical protein